MIGRRAIATTAIGAVCAGVAVPQANAATAPRGLQAAADRMVADGQPGVIVMTRHGNKVSHVTSGVSDKATKAPMDARLQVRIASVTKSFTATVLLQLVAAHRLSLDDTVDKWLPGVVTGNGNDGRKITVRQLLQHTSRLNDYVMDPRIQSEPQRTWTPRELVAIAMEKPPLKAGWSYSDTNYILAGMIIQKITKHDPGVEIRRRIIKPLGLRHTSYPIASRAFPGPYVHGYLAPYGDVSTEISPSSARTSGGIISTVDDVARFHRALFTGRLLPAAQQRQLMKTIPVDDEGQKEYYGLGVYRVRMSCGDAWGHDGGFPGYRTWTYTSRDGRRQAVIVYNEPRPADDDPKFRADRTKAADLAFCG